MKIKLHILKHLPEHIRRNGPAVRFSTEVFKCFNAIFRMSSVLSNHQAPSRDIAYKNADLDRVKHILSGGYWLQDDHWVCAGKDVCALLRKTPILQQHLGWVPQASWTPGLIKRLPRTKSKEWQAVGGSQTLAFKASYALELGFTAESIWWKGMNVTARSGDRCKLGSWVVIRVNTVSFITLSFWRDHTRLNFLNHHCVGGQYDRSHFGTPYRKGWWFRSGICDV